jgi:hypothetical protein
MIRVLKRALISIMFTVGLPMAVCQNTVPSPPAMRLPRGCVYAYQASVILKVPKDFARKSEKTDILSLGRLSFQVAAATREKNETSDAFWLPFKLAEDTSPWTVLCGLHGLNDRESSE